MPKNSNDRTQIAMQRQMDAMGVREYEIGLRDHKTNLMFSRMGSADVVLEETSYLKRKNMEGRHIYIRPNVEHGLILIDDLNAEKLEKLRASKMNPAAVIETSPGNIQVWMKISDKAIPPNQRTQISKMLASEFGGDEASADYRRYGRLAGFTNPKEKYRDARGYQPFVLAHECTGEVAERGGVYAERAMIQLTKQLEARQSDARIVAYRQYHEDHGHDHKRDDPMASYQNHAGRILKHYGVDVDLSRMDWMIARTMAQSNLFSVQQIADAIRTCSPHIEERKALGTDNYAQHTAEKAWMTRGSVGNAGQGRGGLDEGRELGEGQFLGDAGFSR